MRSVLRLASVIALTIGLGACTGLPATIAPAATAPAATAAPASTEAPGSTEAAPVATTGAVEPTGAPSEPPATEPVPTEEATPTDVIATAAPETAATTAPIATAAPEPTMPPAPTETALSIACTPGAVTPAQTEGPYYKENPPEEGSLLQPGMPGTRLTVTGYVLDEQCRPVPGARVDFWQADSAGQYDNQGYTLRGYQLTDAEGRYTLETVLPGLYTGRTRHIHVKVTPRSGPTLTSQLYFPDEAANASDRIFSPELVVNLEKTADGETGTFNFVVKTQ